MSTATPTPPAAAAPLAPVGPRAPEGPLDLPGLLDGARLLAVGCTGFLGKVWLSMLLTNFPNIEHVWMVVRARKRKDGMDTRAILTMPDYQI